MSEALHDMAQPVTAMQCLLYLGVNGPADERLEALENALLQCDRLMEHMRSMREQLGREQQT